MSVLGLSIRQHTAPDWAMGKTRVSASLIGFQRDLATRSIVRVTVGCHLQTIRQVLEVLTFAMTPKDAG